MQDTITENEGKEILKELEKLNKTCDTIKSDVHDIKELMRNIRNTLIATKKVLINHSERK